MKKLLVPTDFSEIAVNAAKYAMALAADLQATKIIFYNAYQTPPVFTETSVPAMPIMDIDTMKDISNDGMVEFLKQMQAFCPPDIELVHQSGFAVLAADINEICQDTGSDLIVMGITGTSKIEEVLIGSTAISVMKNTTIPVIIVPAEATYSPIKNVMLACSYRNVVQTIPVEPIRDLLNTTKAVLHVVNVYESDKEITADKMYQQELLQSLLKDYEPRFHFENNEHFIDGINHFVEANQIDIIITIPRKHKMFEGLFKQRHTKKLAFHSHVPLMYVHHEDL